MSSLQIRSLAANEVSLPLAWAAAEGWNPGLQDAVAFHAADPDGFLVGEVDGRPVGVISAVRAGDGFGFLGLYIVAPEFRGRGHGMAMWRAAMSRLAGRCVGLDGVVAQQANYAKSGFVLAHRNLRQGGVAPAGKPANFSSGGVAAGLVSASEVDFAALVAYDAGHYGARRPEFLRAWLSMEGARALARVEGGVIRGFGVARPCGTGVKIGPLFSEDEAGAELLFNALADLRPGEPLFLDTPEPNPAALALACRHGLAPVFETARMYCGPAPALPLDKIYGITTFELG